MARSEERPFACSRQQRQIKLQYAEFGSIVAEDGPSELRRVSSSSRGNSSDLKYE